VNDEAKQHQAHAKSGGLVAVIVIGLAVVFFLSRWIDTHRPPPNPEYEEARLYVTGKTAKRISLGFNGLIADWYWMRSLQYVGRKIINAPSDVELDNLGVLNLKLLAPLLETATTVDPQFMEPYEYAAVVLPTVNVDEAIRITKKGIAANPSAWRLYQHLGYIYWQRGDFKTASEIYGNGAAIPGAPAWMQVMKARMLTEGGSRNTAREIYTRMYEQSGDEKVKEMARKRLMQLDSLDQRDVIRKVLATYFGRQNRCPSSWREISGALRILRFQLDGSGAPLDPSGAPYRLINKGCDVNLDPKSEIPNR
jgi:tetratricopeptide (TPR) repeat protein